MDNFEKDMDNQENEVQEDTSSLNEETDAPAEETSENSGKKHPPKWLLIGGVAVICIIVGLVLYLNSSSYKYTCAENLLAEGKYQEARVSFAELGDYKDSEQKITECSRRILYNYLQEKDSYTLYAKEYIYELKPDGDKISASVTFPTKNVEFTLLLDMTSGKGKFVCECAPLPLLASTADGDCNISDLKKSDNSLEIDNVSGHYDKEQMKTLADIACNVLCMNFGTVLENTELGLTVDGLGFDGLK